MTTSSFFGMVLPKIGRYCAAYIDRDAAPNPKNGRPVVNHKWFDTIQELAEFYEQVERRNKAGKRFDCYHATATFSQDTRRQIYVAHLRSLYLDLDCGPGKPFRHQRAALAALATFVDDSDLPTPLLVSSGNGLHAYWPFDRDLTPGEWQPLADALKALAVDSGLEIDAGITGDSARILRTPGTTNQKGQKLAEMLLDGDGPYTPDDIAKALSVAPAAKPAASNPKDKTKAGGADFFGDLRGELPKADARVIEAECQQVQQAMADPAGVAEPLWYRLMGLAAFTTGGDKTGQRWSKGHPGYDRAATTAKMAQWSAKMSGPPTCKAFAAENPAGCKGCPYKGKVTTPVQIVPPPVSERVNGMPVPSAPFFVKDDKIWKRVEKIENGNTVAVDALVYRSLLYPVRYYVDPDLEKDVAEWHWQDARGNKQSVVLTAAMSTGNNRDYRGHMADKRIAALDDATTPLLKEYMTSAYDDLLARQDPDVAVRSLGWQKGFSSFALGARLYTVRGISPAQLSSSVARTAEGYGVAGTMDEWQRMTRVLGKYHMYPQQIAIGIGMASVLMPFTGLHGAVISYYGKSGTGKTTAENIQQSVWGDPQLLVRGAKTTPNALYGTFAAMGNMPVALDEASKGMVNNIGELLYSIAVGAEKERMDANAMVKARRVWCLLALLSGNQSFAAQLASSGDVSDAQQRRLLEMEVLPNPALTKSVDVGRDLQRLTYANHGFVGVEWVKFLLSLGEQGIREMIMQAEQVVLAMGFPVEGEDRYRTTVAALIYLSLSVAEEAGWIQFDPTQAVEWMMGQLVVQREQQEAATNDAFDLINLFCNHKIAATVTVLKTVDKTAHDSYGEAPRAVFTEGVVVRREWQRPTDKAPPSNGRLCISRDALGAWLQLRGTDIASVVAELKQGGAVVDPSVQISLSAGTPLSSGRTRCVIIRLDHPRLIQGLQPPTLTAVATDQQAAPA